MIIKFFIQLYSYSQLYIYIQRHTFPLAVPAPTQSIVGCIWATAGTAVMPSPSSWASCSPLLVYTSTKRFMFPITNRCMPSCGCACHCARRLETTSAVINQAQTKALTSSPIVPSGYYEASQLSAPFPLHLACGQLANSRSR